MGRELVTSYHKKKLVESRPTPLLTLLETASIYFVCDMHAAVRLLLDKLQTVIPKWKMTKFISSMSNLEQVVPGTRLVCQSFFISRQTRIQ